MRAIETRNIGFRYPGGPVLFSDVNIHLKSGECVALTGPSGCGKSTLCHILAGIIPRSIPGAIGGNVLLFGEDIRDLPLARIVQLVGIVFQNPDAQLFSPTVEDEIAFGPENLCLPRHEIKERIDNSLRAVHLVSHRLAETQTLSQGQKQLVALGAMLALEPAILICDEVFAQLDQNSTHLVKEVLRLQKEQGCAILMVDHNQDNLEMADRIYRLEGGRIWEGP